MEQYRQPPTPLAPRRPKEQSSVPVQTQKEVGETSPFQKQPKVMRSPKQSEPEVRWSKAKTEEVEKH